MKIDLPIACNLEAFTETESVRYKELFEKLKKSLLTIEETETGYRLHLPYCTDSWMEIAEWVTFENKCCPFFRFAQQLVTEDKIIILHISGPEGSKAIMKEELRGGGCC